MNQFGNAKQRVRSKNKGSDKCFYNMKKRKSIYLFDGKFYGA